MNIAIVTDLHYGRDTNHPKIGGSDYVNTFGQYLKDHGAEVVERLKGYDLIVNLGDLFADEELEKDRRSYSEALTFLRSAGRPVVNAVGNHESRRLSRGEMAEYIGQERTFYSLDHGGFHHIVLDPVRESEIPTNPYLVSEEQLAWLAADLNATPLKSLVYVHESIDEQNVENNYYFKDNPEQAFVQNKKDIRASIENSGKVLGVFNGHLHFHHSSVINNIPYITVPAMSENDGTGKPCMEYLTVKAGEAGITFEVVKI